MNYARPELADRLAAEYVLGSLQGPARRRFETLLPAHPMLRAAVARWEARLVPLSGSVPPVTPPAHVWTAIERRVHGAPASAPAAAAAAGGWRSLAFWRGWSFAATAAAALMAVLWLQPPPAGQPPMVVVLSAPQGAQQFVAGLSADRQALTVRPLQQVDLAADRSLELWAVPAQGAPRSLGLIDARGATVLQRHRVPAGTAALAVSLEPVGGSPTGAPTGPVLYTGTL
jgi:anti-sigma-K factor RskA